MPQLHILIHRVEEERFDKQPMAYHFGNMSMSGQYGSAELQQKITELAGVLDQLDAALQSYQVSSPNNIQIQQVQSFSQTSRQTLTSTTVPAAVPSNYPISDAAWKKLDAIETQAKQYITQLPQLAAQGAAPTGPPVFDPSTGLQLPPGSAVPASPDTSSNNTTLIVGVVGVLLIGGFLVLWMFKKDKKKQQGYPYYPDAGYSQYPDQSQYSQYPPEQQYSPQYPPQSPQYPAQPYPQQRKRCRKN